MAENNPDNQPSNQPSNHPIEKDDPVEAILTQHKVKPLGFFSTLKDVMRPKPKHHQKLMAVQEKEKDRLISSILRFHEEGCTQVEKAVAKATEELRGVY